MGIYSLRCTQALSIGFRSGESPGHQKQEFCSHGENEAHRAQKHHLATGKKKRKKKEIHEIPPDIHAISNCMVVVFGKKYKPVTLSLLKMPQTIIEAGCLIPLTVQQGSNRLLLIGHVPPEPPEGALVRETYPFPRLRGLILVLVGKSQKHGFDGGLAKVSYGGSEGI